MLHNSFAGQNKTNQDLKFQKVDVLEKISDEQYLKSYNEEFYQSLQEKTNTASLTDKNKLFYNFEQNINASVSSTTGQLTVSYFV